MSYKISYILPSRSRPEKFFATLDNIRDMSAKPDYQIIATLDTDDTSMSNVDVMSRLATYDNVLGHWGKSTGKVNAINRDVKFIPKDTDIVILMSDDQKWTQWGFDEIIRIDMQKYFPDLDGVLHYSDGTPAANRLITMSIMGYKYFSRFGFLYDPCYKNVYCDNHFTELSKKLNAYKFVPNVQLYEHKHPAWGTAPMDDLYKRNEEPVSYHKDKEMYFKNLDNNFGV